MYGKKVSYSEYSYNNAHMHIKEKYVKCKRNGKLGHRFNTISQLFQKLITLQVVVALIVQ